MLTTKQKIALARLVQAPVMMVRRLFKRRSITEVRRSGIQWALDLREGIDFSIWLLGSFEPKTVRCYQRLVNPGDVVLDIGANIGAHTLLLAKTVGSNGMVYAFEPTDYAYAKLTRNCSLNPDLASRISCMQCMLVDSSELSKSTPKLFSSWPLKGDTEVHQLHQGRLMTTKGATAKTLDSVVRHLNLERVDCIKLDIDGFECGMLRGSKEVLSRWRPSIIMELAPYALAEQGESLSNLIEILKQQGYLLFDLHTDSPLPIDSEILKKHIPHGASLNVIARAR